MTLCPLCRGAGRHPLDEAGYGAPEHRWIVCECRADDPRDRRSEAAAITAANAYKAGWLARGAVVQEAR